MRYLRYFYVFAWLLAVAFYLRAAFVPDFYAIRNDVPTDPIRSFFIFSLVSGVESMILAVLIRPWSFRGSRGRLLLALSLFAPWAGLCLFSLIHASPFYAAHALWLVLTAFGLAVAAVRVSRVAG